eukprot:3304180-Rhodomonas_salina.1
MCCHAALSAAETHLLPRPGKFGVTPKEQTNVIRLGGKEHISYAACVPSNKCVVLWDDAGELCHIWPHSRRVTSIQVSPDGAVVV